MAAFVIDENVLIAANGRDTHLDEICRLSAIQLLAEAKMGIICEDHDEEIFSCYKKYNNFSGKPGIGDEFFLWFKNNRWYPTKVEKVDISNILFPDDGSLAKFDSTDQKFARVAKGSKNNPTIVNAADSDWLHYYDQLISWGLKIHNLCPHLLKSA